MAANRTKRMIIGGVVAGILVVVVAAVSAGMLDGLFRKSPTETAKGAGVVETADTVRIPLKALDSGKALFLSLESERRDRPGADADRGATVARRRTRGSERRGV